MKQTRRITAAVIMLLLIASCASMNLATPQGAQKALASAQAARDTVRDSIARSFVQAQQNLAAKPNDPAALRLMAAAQAARAAFNKADPAFTTAWQVAADAVDAWLAAPKDQSAADKFQTVFDAVTRALTDVQAAQGATP